jgi:membrane protease YdiL (CAAX protease family)
LRRLLGSVVKRPADARWYLVLLLPVIGSLAVVPVAAFLGLPTAGLFGNLTATALIIPFVVLLPAVAEEIGWRGFILSRVLPRFSPLAVGLLIAVPWSLMHLGLYLPGQPYDGSAVWPSIVTVIALSVIGTWIFVRTDGSVLMTSLFHAGFNAATPFTWSVDPDAAWAIRPVIFALIAFAVVLFGGLRAPSLTDAPARAGAIPVGSPS